MVEGVADVLGAEDVALAEVEAVPEVVGVALPDVLGVVAVDVEDAGACGP